MDLILNNRPNVNDDFPLKLSDQRKINRPYFSNFDLFVSIFYLFSINLSYLKNRYHLITTKNDSTTVNFPYTNTILTIPFMCRVPFGYQAAKGPGQVSICKE
jgi:hypothetical protein